MGASITANEAGRDFGRVHEKARVSPVKLTEGGEETVWMVPAHTYHALWSSYRVARDVRELTDAELALIMEAEPAPETDYEA